MIHNAKNFKIYFGDAQDAISKSEDCIPSEVALVTHEKFQSVTKKLDLEHLAFLNQTHSNRGMEVANTIPAFDEEGDFLITKRPGIGIGIMTADCLPIIMYDRQNHVAAAIHAGWRGAVAGIVQNTLEQMQKRGSKCHDLQVFLGPSAKRCCYQVAEEFKNALAHSMAQSVLSKKNNSYYFDLPLFACLQLHEAGVITIIQDYNHCTLCDHRYFSYRRQGATAGRQMSIIRLNG